MKNLNVALNMKGLNPSGKSAFGSQVYTGMNANPKFTAPFPALSLLNTAIQNLDAAILAAHPGDKASTAFLHQREDELESLLKALAAYVEFTAAGDDAAILSSGFFVKKPRQQPAKVFGVKTGVVSGTAELITKSEDNAAYVWQYTTEPLGSVEWITAGVSVLASFSLGGLAPLTNYWFRVAVVNSSGQQAWSDPIRLAVL